MSDRWFFFHPMPWVVACGLLLTVLFMSSVGRVAAEGGSYYVDCVSGNDNNSGASPATAWQSVNRANQANLQPGDRLLFKRDCVWNKRLDAGWNGTAAQPILIGAYGTGALPRIENGLNQNVKITGSYLIIEYLEAYADPPNVDPYCQNQPYGYIVGFNFMPGAHHNVLRYSTARGHTIGVKLAYNTQYNQILSNTLTNNNVMEVLDPNPSSVDIGAWGILVNGDDNEIAYNYLEDNNGWCVYDTPFAHGNSIELYAARRNSIHHNIAVGDRVFSELGGSATQKAADNFYAYNVHLTSHPGARFIVVRGSGSGWGPTWRTRVFNNTVYYTAPDSQGVVCSNGCSPNILTLKNNILWAEEKAAYADAPFNEGYNLYWRADGNPFVQFQGFAMSNTSQIADPLFVAPGTDMQLQPNSPARDAGTLSVIDWGYTTDLNGTLLPQGPSVDIGAYEAVDVAVVPVPTPSSSPLTWDNFDRTVGSGWGSAESGHEYSYVGPVAHFSVSNSKGTILNPTAASARSAVLDTAVARDVDIRFRVKNDKTSLVGSSQYVNFIARRQGGAAEYRGQIRFASTGKIYLQGWKFASGKPISLGSEVRAGDVTHLAHTYINVRAQVSGVNPTLITMRVWPEGSPEPESWQYTITDAEPILQNAGAVGVRTSLSNSATNAPIQFTFDDFVVESLTPSNHAFGE